VATHPLRTQKKIHWILMEKSKGVFSLFYIKSNLRGREINVLGAQGKGLGKHRAKNATSKDALVRGEEDKNCMRGLRQFLLASVSGERNSLR